MLLSAAPPMGLALLVAVAAAASAEPRVFDLAIRSAELPKESRVVQVRQGDEITLRFTADAPLEIHLHGYDIEKKLSTQGPVTIQFTARATGRFPIEIHAHGQSGARTLGYLEVHPR